ncbi:MAG: carbohydrate ABC transporter permease [Candidatus Rokubacteria bacterium]|nr:carbohydrate ABC transporter permease [Candidatus Rokubacteria bacterium]
MVLLTRMLGRRRAEILNILVGHLLLIGLVAPFFFVFFFMVWNSFKPDYLFFEPGTWVFKPIWLNYADVFNQTEILFNIRNSIVISSLATAIGVICGLLTAYAVTRYNLHRLAGAILVTRMIPYITALVPFWMIFRWLGLINTHVGLVLSHLVITIPFGVWILMGYIEDVPRELEEAAWIDGASRAEAFVRVVVPLCGPGIVAAAILCFIFSWNNFDLALVLGGIETNTAPVAVFKFANPETGGRGQMMAAATLVTIPVFFIVMFIQKKMAAGLTIGGIGK